MKRAGETNEVEILDEAFLHHGGPSSWGAFGSQRMTPAEILEAAEEEEPVGEVVFAGPFMVLLDLVLEGWGAEMSAEKVGKRVFEVAAAMGHRRGKGLAMLGAKKALEAVGSRDVIRRILDWFFVGAVDEVALGKRVVTVGKFVGHSAFDDWSMSNLGRACGETPQAMQERTEVICEDPLRRSGSKGKAAWQQPEWQRKQSRAAQLKFYENKKTT